VAVLVGDFLPLLLTTASEVSADFARYESVPHVTAPAPLPLAQ
jgi:IclR family pca regulon transcriptional regulator